MQISVARMEDVSDLQAAPPGNRAHFPDHLGQLRARDHAIVRRPSASRADRAPRTTACAPSRAGRAPTRSSPAGLPARRSAPRSLLPAPPRCPARPASPSTSMISTASASRGKPRWNASSQHLMMKVSTISSAAGENPRRNDVRNGLRTGVNRLEDRQQRSHGLRQWCQADGDFGHDAHRSLCADDQSDQIVTGPWRP